MRMRCNHEASEAERLQRAREMLSIDTKVHLTATTSPLDPPFSPEIAISAGEMHRDAISRTERLRSAHEMHSNDIKMSAQHHGLPACDESSPHPLLTAVARSTARATFKAVLTCIIDDAIKSVETTTQHKTAVQRQHKTAGASPIPVHALGCSRPARRHRRRSSAR